MTDKRRGCKAKNAAGEACKMDHHLVDQATLLCHAHAPNGQREMSRRGKLGGKSTREAWRRPGLSADELGPLDGVIDAQRWLRLIGAGVVGGRVDRGDATAGIRAVEAWLKSADSLTEEAVLELADKADEIKDEMKLKANRHQPPRLIR